MKDLPPLRGNTHSLPTHCVSNKKWIDTALIIGSLALVVFGLMVYYQVGALSALPASVAYGMWSGAGLLAFIEAVRRAPKTPPRWMDDDMNKKTVVPQGKVYVSDTLFAELTPLILIREHFANLANNPSDLGIQPEDIYIFIDHKELTRDDNQETIGELRRDHCSSRGFHSSGELVVQYFSKEKEIKACSDIIDANLPYLSEDTGWVRHIHEAQGIAKIRLFTAKVKTYCGTILTGLPADILRMNPTVLESLKKIVNAALNQDDPSIKGLGKYLWRLVINAEARITGIRFDIDSPLEGLKTAITYLEHPPQDQPSTFTIKFNEQDYHCDRSVIEKFTSGLCSPRFKSNFIPLDPTVYTQSKISLLLQYLTGTKTTDRIFKSLMEEECPIIYELISIAESWGVRSFSLMGQKILIDAFLEGRPFEWDVSSDTLKRQNLNYLAKVVEVLGIVVPTKKEEEEGHGKED